MSESTIFPCTDGLVPDAASAAVVHGELYGDRSCTLHGVLLASRRVVGWKRVARLVIARPTSMRRSYSVRVLGGGALLRPLRVLCSVETVEQMMLVDRCRCSGCPSLLTALFEEVSSWASIGSFYNRLSPPFVSVCLLGG